MSKFRIEITGENMADFPWIHLEPPLRKGERLPGDYQVWRAVDQDLVLVEGEAPDETITVFMRMAQGEGP